ncbi:MAG: two-component system sensor histidine kinase NtrB [Candidatus Methylomirabilia bacterium]
MSLEVGSRLKSLLSPPVFPGEEEKTTAAVMIHYAILFGLLANLLAIPTMVLAGDPWTRIVVTSGGLLAALFLHALLLRRGYVRSSAAAFGFLAWAALSFINFTAGGVLAPGFSTHVIFIISIGFIFGGRGAFIAAAASTLLGLAFVRLQQLGHLPASQVSNTPERYWFLISMNFVAAAGILNLMVRGFKATIAEGRREVQMRLEVERKLERHQGVLEETVRTRTADLERVNRTLTEENLERRRAEVALRLERDFIANLMETSPAGILTLDGDGRIVFANAAAEKILGLDRREIERGGHAAPNWRAADHLGRALPETRLPFASVIAGGEPVRGVHVSLETGDRRSLLLSVNAAPFGEHVGRPGRVVMTIEDVTDRVHTEQELFKKQKLESVGILAGGIAHDFNNLLAVMLGSISLARMEVPPGETAAHDLEQAEQAILQARELTQQLLTFSRGGAPILQEIDIGPVAVRAVQFALHGTNVRADCVVPAELWVVRGDEGQIDQVFHNLALNACQAMPEGGTIGLRAANVVIDAGPGAAVLPGNCVKVTVADSGTGIPEEILAKIFDPYFTTKETGTGLGLAVAYSVIRNHGGHIGVESKEGVGSTFTIHLPAVPARRSAGAAAVPITPGKGRVLFMDDEPLVREVLGRMLHALGYSTEAAADGAAAVDAYRCGAESGHPFDAVILDLTVPGGVGGAKALELLRAIDPAVRAIVSSGYSNDPVMATYREHGFYGVLVKPFQVAGLSAVLHEVLTQLPAPR